MTFNLTTNFSYATTDAINNTNDGGEDNYSKSVELSKIYVPLAASVVGFLGIIGFVAYYKAKQLMRETITIDTEMNIPNQYGNNKFHMITKINKAFTKYKNGFENGENAKGGVSGLFGWIKNKISPQTTVKISTAQNTDKEEISILRDSNSGDVKEVLKLSEEEDSAIVAMHKEAIVNFCQTVALYNSNAHNLANAHVIDIGLTGEANNHA